MSAQPKFEYSFESDILLPESQEKPPFVGLADAQIDLSIPSPANALQARLEQAFNDDVVEDRWSPRKSMALVLGSCGTFWALAAYAVYAVYAII